MTKITLGFSILVATSLFVASCNKKTNTAPEADMEFQSSKDVSYATSLVTEIDDIAGYLGEGYTNLNTPYFINAGGTGSIIYATPSADVITLAYSGTVNCMDGKKRSGTVSLDFSGSSVPLGASKYRDAGFVGKVTLNNYVVDGYSVVNNTTFTITNTTASGFPATSVPVTWKLDGNFSIFNGTGTMASTDSMTWKGILNKTLTNSTNSLVMASNKMSPIKWVTYTTTATPPAAIISAAKCAYSGTVTGKVSKTKDYTLVVKDGIENSLYRDFSCAPNKITFAITTSLTVANAEWHPITQGVCNFTVAGATEPRVIDYGMGCDNNGTVIIKGISYPIDFKK